ncbi:MAG: DUF2905 family protein [Woeseiaceae bacterium]|nr:DUF2905 family protein [Woeseiaceae bacterium]
MQRTLIIIGLVVILAGLFWPWLSQLPSNTPAGGP